MKIRSFPSQPWHNNIGGCGCDGCQAHARVYIWSKLATEEAARRHASYFFGDRYDESNPDLIAKRVDLEIKINGPHGYALYKMMLAKRKAK